MIVACCNMHLHFYPQLDWCTPEKRNHLPLRCLDPLRFSPRCLWYVVSLLSLLVVSFFDLLDALYAQPQFSLRRAPGLGTLALNLAALAQLACLKLFGELWSHLSFVWDRPRRCNCKRDRSLTMVLRARCQDQRQISSSFHAQS